MDLMPLRNLRSCEPESFESQLSYVTYFPEPLTIGKLPVVIHYTLNMQLNVTAELL